MYSKMIAVICKNDILKSKLITFVTVIFIMISSMLVSLAAILIINLSDGIKTIMKESETPHFMQMHSGDIDYYQFQSFTQQNDKVEKAQILEFLNIDGGQISINGNSFISSAQDNGLVTQSRLFDYLLATDGSIIIPADGELYVPIYYMKEGTASLGDRAVICGKEFTVAGFLRDSQMNSSLASSKRFLVSDSDFEDMRAFGNIEYLIEFRLKDLSLLSTFESEYISEGLKSNGPTITYPLFKMMNAVSDGIMIAVILLISLLVIAVSFMCIRFTLLAKIEDDLVEIGTMKAIGMRVSDIKKIYLSKYAVIGLVGCTGGFILSFLLKGILLENIRLYMGGSGNNLVAELLGFTGVAIVFLMIIMYVNKVLNSFKKLSVTEAMRLWVRSEKHNKVSWMLLSRNKLINTNIFLGIRDVFSRKKLYASMLMVFIISAFIMIVPRNIYNTISSRSFISYMGIGECDIRIDIQQTDNIYEKGVEIYNAMANDSEISKQVLLTTKLFTVINEDGTRESIRIEFGDHTTFPIAYTQGAQPLRTDEIALSVLNAEDLNKRVGDEIVILSNGNETSLKVCGIYSDITNGGKTAKAIFTDSSEDVMWCIVNGELTNKAMAGSKVSEYGGRYGFAKATGIDEYIIQIFGVTMDGIKKAALIALVLSVIIVFLITLLFIKMIIAKDRYSISVSKALGFTNKDISMQYGARSIIVLLIGLVIGVIAANTIGESIAGLLISSFGVSSFRFNVNVAAVYVLCPVLMICPVVIATVLATSNIERISGSIWIK